MSARAFIGFGPVVCAPVNPAVVHNWRSGLHAVNSIVTLRPSTPAFVDMLSFLQTPFRGRAYHAIVSAAVASLLVAQPSSAQSDASFLRVRVDDARNRAILEVPAAQVGKDFLHQVTLTTGLGVAGGPGLDRGQTGSNAVVRLERRGNRLLLMRDNYGVRAPAGDAANQRAAADAFPRSVVASFTIDTERDGVITVDASSLFLADAYGVADALRGGQGGTYRVDATRSWLDTARTKSFPRNAEVHAVLTFVSDAPGASLRRAAPDAKAITFEQHHSLVVLPDAGHVCNVEAPDEHSSPICPKASTERIAADSSIAGD